MSNMVRPIRRQAWRDRFGARFANVWRTYERARRAALRDARHKEAHEAYLLANPGKRRLSDSRSIAERVHAAFVGGAK